MLEGFGVTVAETRAQVTRIAFVGEGGETPAGQIPFTARAKKVLELALREALSLGHNYIGTEHLLLGLVRENDGVGARILLGFGADAESVRERLLSMLSGTPAASALTDEALAPPGAGGWRVVAAVREGAGCAPSSSARRRPPKADAPA